MVSIGALSLTAPWLLLGFLLLPLLWWLLRVSPPAPLRLRFPALQLLLGLDREEETPKQMPLWLLILRAALAGVILVLLAGPLWNAQNYGKRTGPLVLVVDNGWAAAPGWILRQRTLSSLTQEASRNGRPVVILPTTIDRPVTFRLLPPQDAVRAAERLAPQPFAPDRQAVMDKLPDLGALLDAEETMKRQSEIIWLSDGFDYGQAKAFAEKLRAIGPLTILSENPYRLALALAPPVIGEKGTFNVPVQRAFGAAAYAREGKVALYDSQGRVLETAPFILAPEEIRTEAEFDLPTDLRNRAVRIALTAERSAASTVLLDSSWRRRPVGLVSGSGSGEERPLLSDLYYLRRALEPYAEMREGAIESLIKSGLSVLVLSDIGQLVGEDQSRVAEWVKTGGVLIRFAGPRLAQKSDDLIPVRLRRGGRALGGTLSWETPQGLSPFEENSPFADLDISDEVVVRQQVLAEPSPDLSDKTWARLADGTPLVTARREEMGWLILVHVTANQDWSTLPLSGLYVHMLRRMIALSSGIASSEGETNFTGVLAPSRVMNGYGDLVPPGAAVEPLTAGDFENAPSAEHPPGLYGREGTERAFNLASTRLALRAAERDGALASHSAYLQESATDLRPAFALLALILILTDFIATLRLTGHMGRLERLLRRGAAALLLIGILNGWGSPGAMAAPPPLEVTRQAHLAYVITGDVRSDALTRRGLEALGGVLEARTAFEPGPPVGIDPERDDLVFYPLLYWRVTPAQRPLSPAALQRVDEYMKNGGTILFDTADSADPDLGLAAPGATAQGMLRSILAPLDIPPLERVPEGHVLGKAFYLLSEFPGRYAGGAVWVEVRGEDGVGAAPSLHDGVSPIIIGGNDWAAAWAKDANGQPMVATTPGGDRQRELAYRFGVNLVMYTLSGNYKADQVHVPEILERLGQ